MCDTKVSNTSDTLALSSVPRTSFGRGPSHLMSIAILRTFSRRQTLIDGGLRNCEYCNGCELMSKLNTLASCKSEILV
ncbi:hypothetical protein EMIT0P43_30283 [Pseudomonas jessenii]